MIGTITVQSIQHPARLIRKLGEANIKSMRKQLPLKNVIRKLRHHSLRRDCPSSIYHVFTIIILFALKAALNCFEAMLDIKVEAHLHQCCHIWGLLWKPCIGPRHERWTLVGWQQRLILPHHVGSVLQQCHQWHKDNPQPRTANTLWNEDCLDQFCSHWLANGHGYV